MCNLYIFHTTNLENLIEKYKQLYFFLFYLFKWQEQRTTLIFKKMFIEIFVIEEKDRYRSLNSEYKVKV